MSDVRSLRAIAHPLRLRMLSLLTGAELSAADVARQLGTTQANASYHLRQLAAAGQLEVTGTVAVRGGRAKLYRYRWSDDSSTDSGADSGSGEQDDGRTFLAAMAAELTRRGDERAPDEGRSIFVDAEVWVPDDVVAEVRALLRRVAARVHDEARPPRTPATTRVNLTSAFFPMRDGDAGTDDGPS